ncbi:MAG: hypothetical protein HZB51_21960 [Chloroflexi bacterium]|nr:hypothetical protein [Chloroflexota bacterium]
MKPQHLKWLSILFFMMFALVACSSAPTKPTVVISAGALGNIAENQDLTVQVIATDEKGVAQIELLADNQVVSSASINPAQKSVTTPLVWKTVGGQHVLSARSIDVDNLQSDPAILPVTIAFANKPTPTAAPTKAAPTATAVPAGPTATALPTGVPCTNAFAFVADVTYPDGTSVTPGQQFNKTWRIKNTGTCAWTSAYQFVRVAGEQMSSSDAYAMPPTAPGATADVTVPMTAPATPGAHSSRWQLRDPNGVIAQPAYVLVQVVTVIPAPPAVSILSPGTGFSFAAGTTVKVTFQGTSNYTEMASVTLYVNGQSVMKQTSRTPSRQITGSFDWKPGAGNYDLYVIGIDIHGGQTTSAHIAGTIVQPQPTCQLSVNFRADRTTINAGEHTTLRWDVDCANAVYLNGQGVTGHEARDIAPSNTTAYTLRSVRKDGSNDDRTVTIQVNTPAPQPTRRNVSGNWVSGNYNLELTEAFGCGGNDCGVKGRLIEAHGVTTPSIDDVSGSINVYSGAMSLIIARPGASGISCNVAANSASMSCSGSFGTLTFAKQ